MLSLYVHLPWCVKKCPYCDFNSHVYHSLDLNKPALPEAEYIQALKLDLTESLALYPDLSHREIQSVFFGGGTPSLFSGQAIEEILTNLSKHFHFSPHCEITLEANPGTVERKHFRAYRKAGVNRLSLGIQSFNAEHLKKLGRIHDSLEAKQAISIAREAGFDNLNLDIMYGLINQSLSEALEDLSVACGHQPEHLSWYNLSLEPNTLFYKQRPPLPEDNVMHLIENQGDALLKTHGYTRYEISAYARPNHQAKHNLNYWQFGDYLGLGAGAHSKITTPTHKKIHRLIKHKHPKTYLDCLDCAHAQISFVQENKIVCDQDKPMEFMMNALRLVEGVDLSLFEQCTGLPLSRIEKILLKAKHLDLLDSSEKIKPTKKGLLFLNDLVNLFSEDI